MLNIRRFLVIKFNHLVLQLLVFEGEGRIVGAVVEHEHKFVETALLFSDFLVALLNMVHTCAAEEEINLHHEQDSHNKERKKSVNRYRPLR